MAIGSNDRMTVKSETPDAPLFKIYPSNLQKAKIAWMSCGNSVGFEVFEFIDPPHQPSAEFEYNRRSSPFLILSLPSSLLSMQIADSQLV